MTARVHHADLWGKRQDKYDWLDAHDVNDTHWTTAQPQPPFYLFTPQDTKLEEEYDVGWRLPDFLRVSTVGVVTGQDAKTIGLSPEDAGALAQALHLPEEHVQPLLYRPFDLRFVVYHPSAVTRPRESVMRHMLAGENLALISARSNKTQTPDQFLCTDKIMETKCGESSTQSCLFPLYLYPSDAPLVDASRWPAGKEGRRPNLSPAFVEDFAGRLGLEFVSDGRGDLERTFGPEDVFHWAYAVFHSPTYRSRYAPFLKIDFPRLPLTSDRALFARLCGLGAELTGLHLLEAVPAPAAAYPRPGDNVVRRTDTKARPMYAPPTGEHAGRVQVNDEQYFEPVPPEVWAFQVGGYQVCRKWLKDRKGRTLSHDDVEHYRKVTEAIRQTIRLMGEIDAAIPAWPLP